MQLLNTVSIKYQQDFKDLVWQKNVIYFIKNVIFIDYLLK